jgi:hypothetical protein
MTLWSYIGFPYQNTTTISFISLYRISENMIKITENQFQAVCKLWFSEWNCDDVDHVNTRRMPGEWNLFWQDAESRLVIYWKFAKKPSEKLNGCQVLSARSVDRVTDKSYLNQRKPRLNYPSVRSGNLRRFRGGSPTSFGYFLVYAFKGWRKPCEGWVWRWVLTNTVDSVRPNVTKQSATYHGPSHKQSYEQRWVPTRTQFLRIMLNSCSFRGRLT